MQNIVITGGPCSGKSTALNYITEKLESIPYIASPVICVPEIATLLINGLRVLPKNLDRRTYFEFQSRILRTQRYFEDFTFNPLQKLQIEKKHRCQGS